MPSFLSYIDLMAKNLFYENESLAIKTAVDAYYTCPIEEVRKVFKLSPSVAVYSALLKLFFQKSRLTAMKKESISVTFSENKLKELVELADEYLTGALRESLISNLLAFYDNESLGKVAPILIKVFKEEDRKILIKEAMKLSRKVILEELYSSETDAETKGKLAETLKKI